MLGNFSLSRHTSKSFSNDEDVISVPNEIKFPWNLAKVKTENNRIQDPYVTTILLHSNDPDESESNRKEDMNFEPIPDITKYLSVYMAEEESNSNDKDNVNKSIPSMPTAASFNSQDNLSDEGPLEGEVCSFCYKIVNKRKIKKHMSQHSGEKPYQCEYCNRCFSRSDKLSAHQKCHFGQENYNCFCGMSFERSDLMKLHACTHNLDPQLREALVKDLKGIDKIKLVPDSVPIPSDSLECPYCHVFFSGSYKYNRHIRTHTGEKPFVCTCGESFNRSELLKKHQLSKVCRERLQLDKIGMINEETEIITIPPGITHPSMFFDSSSPSPPSIQITPLDPLDNTPMEPCLSLSLFQSRLMKDTLSNDKPKKPKPVKRKKLKKLDGKYMCEYCDKGFTKSHKLSIHRRIHTGEKPYKCETCGKKFTRRDHMIKHNNVHLKYRKAEGEDQDQDTQFHLEQNWTEPKMETNEISSQFEQSLSEFISSKMIEGEYIKQEQFENEIEELEKITNKPFSCLLCNDSFNNIVEFQKHVSFHGGKPKFKCEICSKLFKVRKNYEAHILNHETKNDIDDPSCTSSDILEAKNKRVQCKICNRWLVSQSSLEIHARSHTGEKPFKCDQCHTSYMRKADMVRHRKNHFNEGKFHCNICSASFTRKDKLLSHDRKYHAKDTISHPSSLKDSISNNSGDSLSESDEPLSFRHLLS